MLARIAFPGETIFKQPLERHFAKRAARFCTAKDALKRLRSLGHLAARLLHGAQLLLNLSESLLRILEFAGHRRLRLGGDLCGLADAVLKRFGYAIEALRDGLPDRGNLPSALCLCCRNRLQIATQF